VVTESCLSVQVENLTPPRTKVNRLIWAQVPELVFAESAQGESV